MPDTPPARRRLIGAALRRHRESLGYRLDDAARILECDRSKISRIESGQRGIRPRDLRDLLTEYGVTAQEQQTLIAIAYPNRATSWWHPYTDVLPAPWLDYLITEAAASRIEIYQPQQIPGLLQTQDYARSVTAADPTLSLDTQDLLLKALLTRQQLILEERRPEVTVVIGEAALHQVVGGPDVMHAQLIHLTELTGTHPYITIRVLPFTSRAHLASGAGPLSILQFTNAPTLGIVHLPGPCGGISLDSPPDIASYTRDLTLLCTFALTPADTIRLLRDAAARYQTHGSVGRSSRC